MRGSSSSPSRCIHLHPSSSPATVTYGGRPRLSLWTLTCSLPARNGSCVQFTGGQEATACSSPAGCAAAQPSISLAPTTVGDATICSSLQGQGRCSCQGESTSQRWSTHSAAWSSSARYGAPWSMGVGNVARGCMQYATPLFHLFFLN